MLIFGTLIVLIVVYALFNPAEGGYFPRCPFRMLTGLECPGCGSQRAVHNLLNLNVRQAARENVLLVIAIPYVITGFVFDMIKEPSPEAAKWRKRLFGTKAIWVVLTLIIVFTVLRNIPFSGKYI